MTYTCFYPYHSLLHLSCHHSRSLHHRWREEVHKGQCHTENGRADIWIPLLKKKLWLWLTVQSETIHINTDLVSKRGKLEALHAKQKTSSCTYGSQQVHLIHRHSHPLCHTSTRKGCTHLSHSETISNTEKIFWGKHRIWISDCVYTSVQHSPKLQSSKISTQLCQLTYNTRQNTWEKINVPLGGQRGTDQDRKVKT